MNLASINECRAAINYNAGRFIEQRLDEAVSRAVDEMIEQNRRANRTAALEAAHAACEKMDCDSLHCARGLRNRRLYRKDE